MKRQRKHKKMNEETSDSSVTDGQSQQSYDTDKTDTTDTTDATSNTSAQKDNHTMKHLYTEDDITYFTRLNPKKRKMIANLENVLMKRDKRDMPLRFKVLESDMSIELKSIAIAKVNQMAAMEASYGSGSGEYHKMNHWIEHVCKLPIGKYVSLPCGGKNTIIPCKFIQHVHTTLNSVVYGHKDAKNQIVRLLAKWIVNPDSKGMVIGIQGVHGIGKTSLVKEGICKALGLPFGFISLGGVSDGSYLYGHSYTYEGSRWGRICDILMKTGCMNPVLYFDELDKVSTTSHGEEIIHTLIHLCDSSQNDTFQDKYFVDVDIDLSRCLIVFSFNNIEHVNPILLDRMNVIRTEGYDTKDKVIIARDYMLPKILNEYAIHAKHFICNDETLRYIIQCVEEEQGVRNLKRALEEIVSQVNLELLLNYNKDCTVPQQPTIHVTKETVDKYLSKPKKEPNSSLNMMYI